MSRSGRGHLIAMSIVAAVLSAVLFYVFFRTDIIPLAASRERGYIDTFLRVMFAIASVFFAIIVTVYSYSLIFFRRRREGPAATVRGNSALELTWTLVPLAIVIGLSAYGGAVLADMGTKAPATELQVNVMAFRFGWRFTYPQYGNISSAILELPVDRRVHFEIQSMDVVHSFWVQELGPKQDAVPGMTTELYVTPTKTGNYLVECSQLCGYGHTLMVAPCRVVSAADFDMWVSQQPKPTPTPSSPTTTPAPSSTVNLVARNIAFDLSTIIVPAGQTITVNFDNQDQSVPHNFAAYMDQFATTPIFVGQIITGPAKTTYTFTAPSRPGRYFFRCDVHPTTMTGTLVVQ